MGKSRSPCPYAGRTITLTSSAWIFTFDSLGGKHPPVYTCLKRWLEHEAKDKKQIDYVPTPARYKEARVRLSPSAILESELIRPGSPAAQLQRLRAISHPLRRALVEGT